jgi:ankyrin repeat protein
MNKSEFNALDKRIKILESQLLESKQVGTLYHVCTLSAYLKYILPTDTLSSSGKYTNWLYKGSNYVSFTRDKKFTVETGTVDKADVLIKLVVDGDKLSEHYKIGPYNDFAYDYKGNKFDDSDMILYREKEEVVKGPIKNISKYIKAVYFDAKSMNQNILNSIKRLSALNNKAQYQNFIAGKSTPFKMFLKNSEIKNGTDIYDCISIFENYTDNTRDLFSYDLDKIRSAIENGADINAEHDKYGLPLNFYCKSDDNYKIVKYLLANNADTLGDSYGITPLHVAAQYDCVRLISFLVENGLVDCDVQTDDGTTPLMLAVKYNNYDSAYLLLDYGADQTIKSNNGLTVYKLAKNQDIVDLLREYD